MSRTNYTDKKIFIHTEKKLEKIHYRIVIGLMIFAIIYYYFFEPKIIGYDNKYLIYIFALPTIIGMVILGFYRRQFLIHQFSTNKGFVLWTFMIFFYLIQGLMFSYLSFGQIAKISWHYFNNEAVKHSSNEILNCPITRFWTGRNPCIDFKFNERHESFKVSYPTIKEYENKNGDDYILQINGTKGLWNYYKVNKWNIEHK